MSIHLKIKKNDFVLVVAGNDRGKKGKVLKVFPEKRRVVVEGVNFIKRHQRPTQKNPQGGIITREGPIHISNVMLVDPKSGNPTRIGRKVLGEGESRTRVRYSKASNEMIRDER